MREQEIRWVMPLELGILAAKRRFAWDLSRREDWRIRPLRGFATSREANTPSASECRAMHKQQRAIHLRQGYGGLKAKMKAQKKSFAAKPRDPRSAAR